MPNPDSILTWLPATLAAVIGTILVVLISKVRIVAAVWTAMLYIVSLIIAFLLSAMWVGHGAFRCRFQHHRLEPVARRRSHSLSPFHT